MAALHRCRRETESRGGGLARNDARSAGRRFFDCTLSSGGVTTISEDAHSHLFRAYDGCSLTHTAHRQSQNCGPAVAHCSTLVRPRLRRSCPTRAIQWCSERCIAAYMRFRYLVAGNHRSKLTGHSSALQYFPNVIPGWKLPSTHLTIYNVSNSIDRTHKTYRPTCGATRCLGCYGLLVINQVSSQSKTAVPIGAFLHFRDLFFVPSEGTFRL